MCGGLPQLPGLLGFHFKFGCFEAREVLWIVNLPGTLSCLRKFAYHLKEEGGCIVCGLVDLIQLRSMPLWVHHICVETHSSSSVAAVATAPVSQA